MPDWLENYAPLGILREIPARGVFPPLTKEEQNMALSGYALIDVSLLGVDLHNYSSYTEYQRQADQELEREIKAGFALAGTRAELEARVGILEPSRVGVIVK